jgi:predicted transcriptional regulator
MKVIMAKICGITFATISIYCSALLWWSFADKTIDQVIAAIIGSGFVACQYLFYANRNYIASTVLFTISVTATMGWIESCYDSIKTTELSSNSSYHEKTKTLTELNNSLTLQNLSAKNDLANTSINFTGRANRTLAKAKQTQYAIKQIEQEIEQLKNANPSSQKSGSAIANKLADYRWGLWFLLAAMVDLIPRICYKIISSETTVIKSNNTSTATLHETLQPSLQKALQPSSQLGATPETQAEIADPLLQILRQEIIDNEWGETIPMKRIMAKHNARHDRLKPIFEWLIKQDVIERQGNRYMKAKTETISTQREQIA